MSPSVKRPVLVSVAVIKILWLRHLLEEGVYFGLRFQKDKGPLCWGSIASGRQVVEARS